MDDVDRPIAASVELPNPAALTRLARKALAQGSPAVAFPVPDVLKLADDMTAVLELLSGMKAIIDTQAIAGRVTVDLGRQILNLAELGEIDALAAILIPFRAAIEALDSALPEAEAEDEAAPPLAH